MAQGFYAWSTTASSNGNADTSVNFQEGQAPSSLNDSNRAAMARLREWGNDIAGSITTGGTATAYTVASSQAFDALAHLANQIIGFVPHATNTNAAGADVTLNVDSLGAKPIRMQPSVALPGGTLVLGTPYVVTYNNSDGVFYLRNMTNPYAIPLGGMIDFTGTTAPNSSFVLPFGQAISRTTYATYFNQVSTTYGSGDGSTTFNVIDLRGRVAIGKDDMGGSAASRVTTAGSSIDGVTLGATGGAQNRTLSSGQIPSLTSTGSNTITVTGPSGHTLYGDVTGNHNLQADGSNPLAPTGGISASNWTFTGSNSISVTYTNGSQTALITAQPSIIVTKILRVI